VSYIAKVQRSADVIVTTSDIPNRWKDPKNRYRQKWNVSNVPTIVKMQGVREDPSSLNSVLITLL
jgi:hypothetical protein